MEGAKRQHQRFPCIGIVEIKEKQNNGPSRIVSAMLNNISRTGLKCNATKHHSVGSLLCVVTVLFVLVII
jgi:hypothetical protein